MHLSASLHHEPAFAPVDKQAANPGVSMKTPGAINGPEKETVTRGSDLVSFSSAGLSEAGAMPVTNTGQSEGQVTGQVALDQAEKQPQTAEEGAKAKGANGEPLTEKEEEQVEKLEARDVEVKTHEMAHKNAAGPYARGGPNYVYQTGPDGRRYAVGGSVQIDTSEVKGDPRKTIEKMQVVKRAALAPAEPSNQDRKVAAQATQKAAKAQAELAKESEKLAGSENEGDASQIGKGENGKDGVKSEKSSGELSEKSGENASVSGVAMQQFVSQAQQMNFQRQPLDVMG